MSRRIARPYASSLFSVIEKEGIPALREVERQLAVVAEVLRQEPRLLAAIEVPSVTRARKTEIVTALSGAAGLRPEAARLLQIMAGHMRLRYLSTVVAMLGELADRKEGLQRGKVLLPTAPERTHIDALAATMTRLLGTRVELTVEVRPELLAGFVVRVGSRVWDGSLDAQLRRFAAGAERR